MTWVSLVCLLALTSSALGHYGNAYRARVLADRTSPLTSYGSVQGGSSQLFDQTAALQQQQRPFLSTLSLGSQTGYGQQTQIPQGVDLSAGSSLGIQQDTQSQQVLPTQSSSYGSSSYGSQQQQQIPQQQQQIPQQLQQQIPQQQYSQQQQIPQQQFVPQQQQKKVQGLNLQGIVQNDQSYGSQSQYGSGVQQQRVQQQPQLDMLRGYGNQQQMFDQQQQQQQAIPTPADILCKGQRAETVIPLDNGRKFVVCLDEGKGVEQSCPKGLHYHVDSRRCERKLGPLDNPCASQPCLNGGQCVPTDVTSYQCQCPQGFDGKTCELDARVCQIQQPCGQTPDSRCQSFRLGAALQHVCICQQETAYGLNCQQAQPNPCQGVDGPQALAFSDKGFIMCDGERMFVESCPGGTIWDDLNKACVWPDMQGVVGGIQQNDQSSQQSYGQQQQQQIPQQRLSMIGQTGIKSYAQRPQQLDQSLTSSYSQRPQQFDQSSISSYTQQRPQQLDQSSISSYTQQRPQQLDQTVMQQQPQQQSYQQSQQTFQQPQQQLQQQPQQSFQQTYQQQPQQQLQQQPQQWQKPQQLQSWQKPQQQQDLSSIQQQSSGY